MKWLLYGAVIAAALLVPVERSDVGKLQPIEVVAIYADGNEVVMKTDLGDEGHGRNVSEALEDMKDTAKGIIYLDTAEYLLAGPGTEQFIKETDVYLKRNVRTCAIEEELDLMEAAKYLDSHRPERKLKEDTKQIEVLRFENGKYRLMKKE